MPLALIKEDGTGKVDANSFASAAEGDAYHDGHLYASAWTGATTQNKEKALVMATRLINAHFQFRGVKRRSAQSLQWPRRGCPDPDNDACVLPGLLRVRGAVLEETKVPALVVSATCELARELLKQDRTGDTGGEGLRALEINGSMRLDFDADTRPAVIPMLVQTWLAKFGEPLTRGPGVARLVRT